MSLPTFRRALGRAAVFLLLAASLRAQDRPYAGIVLRVPASTRALALGNANVAGRDDDVIFYSPAQLAVARGTSISGERYTATTSGGSLSTLVRIGSGGIGFGASWLSYATEGTYPGSRADFTTSGGFGGSSFLAAVGLAQTFKGFRIGVAGKYVREELAVSEDRALVDVGVGRDFTIWIPFQAALSLQNLGSDFSSDAVLVTPDELPGLGNAPDRARLPMRASLGLSSGAPVGPLDLAALAQLSVLRDGFVAPAGGIEAGYSWLDGHSIALRAGARRPENGEGVLTAGAGFSVDRISIDYALETLTGGRTAHRVGLRIR
jgi:hypothetical protein